MKTEKIKFSFSWSGKEVENSAEIRVGKLPGDVMVGEIKFSKPVGKLSIDQFIDMSNKIDDVLFSFKKSDESEQAENPETGLTVAGDNNPVQVPSKVGGLYKLAEKMALDLEKKGKFSEGEKKDVSKAFDLINKFLGGGLKK